MPMAKDFMYHFAGVIKYITSNIIQTRSIITLREEEEKREDHDRIEKIFFYLNKTNS